jgi:hypothetical protein
VEQSDNGSLEFRTTASVDGSWGEGFPDNALTDVGSNEERDTGSQTVALLEKLIQENDNEAGYDKLEDQKKTHTGTEIAGLTIQTSQDVYCGLSERKNNGEYYTN